MLHVYKELLTSFYLKTSSFTALFTFFQSHWMHFFWKNYNKKICPKKKICHFFTVIKMNEKMIDLSTSYNDMFQCSFFKRRVVTRIEEERKICYNSFLMNFLPFINTSNPFQKKKKLSTVLVRNKSSKKFHEFHIFKVKIPVV